ncbi:hypothetical protein SAMN05421819_2808 [Bryocella elongata]|uniref:Uncharacterized protein n=1 Tax=Bryocella elongata TaxID=863522 RepID=A0A1H5ZQA5_9BACT|nr:hypothetical protein [Bryocella elongata]SEG38372.1 hypothetical protein SAMN05421819_2808 [Bryocella elongata]
MKFVDAGGMKRLLAAGFVGLAAYGAGAQISVPAAPNPASAARDFRDSRYGVHLEVPAGWTLARRDGELSNFLLDVKGSPASSVVRAASSMDFNPFPHSTFGGALLYFTVQPNSDERSCEKQADASAGKSEVVGIGGMGFTHAHVEHGSECVEARDDVYTAYRKHACYRFDLEVNTFCSGSSGAQELSAGELHDIEARLAGILSTVTFSWEKSGAQEVPVSDAPVSPRTPLKSSLPDAAKGPGTDL